MHRTAILCLLVALASASLAPGAAAQAGRRRAPRATAQAVARFTEAERQIIVTYYHDHHYAAKPLPPGIAKNLARGKPLPPGIAKRALPADLVALMPRRTGVEITIFGDRVVLLEASGLVVDILESVFH